jgi:cytochrome c biogenesis protein CcdA
VFTSVVTLAIWSILIWQYSHDGVPSHHFFHSADFPAMSNWWGGLILPALSWFLLGRIHQRILSQEPPGQKYPLNIIAGFVIAFLYGALISILFLNIPEITGQVVLGIFLIAVFVKVYREECILGFILGMSYTFGAIIPFVFAFIFAFASALIYHAGRYILSLFRNSSNRGLK